ncbi:fimbrillin family protein [uncultured Parabacteroides sp.]|uniref:fimbrillin family protein n=1 Tax=uncultured Parabacteroides sp. TaxID=512312 RepID=UPI0025907C91|nr:fimbrillin family protein [uncultured Parabacteroides sp.]
MKTGLVYMFLSLALLCACGSSDEELSGGMQQPGEALELIAVAGNFVTPGDAPNTRAADNGAATTFENDDRVGVIVLEGDAVIGNNLPYKYDGTKWVFDIDVADTENTGKSLFYYDSQASNLTYIVYYPYSTKADNVASVEGDGGLKSKFIPQEDQRTEDAYRMSDLMIWQSATGIAPLRTLNATLVHAYNSVSIQPEVRYTLAAGQDFIHPSPAISDVRFVTGDATIVTPYYAEEDGSYRYILPPGFTGSVRCFYTFDNQTYHKEFTVSAPASNTRYGSVQNIHAGDYSLDKAQLGDFYCRNSDGEGYLIPNDVKTLSEQEEKECVGIVYWLGDIKGDNYGLLDSKFPGGTHGLVVSLWDMPDPDNGEIEMIWTYGKYEYVDNWLGSKNVTCTWDERPENFSSIQVTDKMQGYANTIALKEYNRYIENPANNKYQTYRVKPVRGLDDFNKKHQAPSNSSGWYWPSIEELRYVCWGQGATTGTAGKDMLNTQIQKVSGSNAFGSDYYWSSTEYSGHNLYVWVVYFYKGEEKYYGVKQSNDYRVRPLLTF